MKSVSLPAIAALLFLISSSIASGEIKVVVDHNDNDHANPAYKFKTVPSPTSPNAATPATFAIVDGEKHPLSGDLDVLHDSKLPTEPDQPMENFVFNAGINGGRLSVDLGNVIKIRQVNTYSWHPNTRGPQVYKLYASDGEPGNFNARPAAGTDPATVGWKFIARVDTRPPSGDGGGQYGVSISNSSGPIGSYRYLLFVISQTEGSDTSGNTFYSKIDVIGAEAKEAK